ncbi:MAG: HAD family hydrolase [Oscillospiraceae bacterium]|nr:HAD family hydrolase [Oscillospiraceae bacterium]
MAIQYILFDLDGTLLPMDQELFVKAYVKGLAVKMAPLGFDPQKVIDGLWAGTGAMIKNNTGLRNDEVFWKVFCSFAGVEALNHMDTIDDFYANEFQQIRNVCGFTHEAAVAVRKIKELGYRVVLATNPLFPPAATESRVRWAGLQPEDFELITVYDNSYHCKPNPAYYEDVLRAIGAKGEECVMIGNDAKEDMIAETLGMKVFLLTDCLINSENRDISGYPQGSFADMMSFIGQL